MGQGAGGADLYDPAFEKDSCGFGLIAQLDDRPSRAIVDAALDALRRMTHRGAVAADGKAAAPAPAADREASGRDGG